MTAVSVDELQRAWAAVEAGRFRTRAGDSRHTELSTRWNHSEPVIAVAGTSGRVGATTVALAIATAAETPARVVECCSMDMTGMASATTAELGVDDSGWRRGDRDSVVIERTSASFDHPGQVPMPSPTAKELTIVDVGWDLALVQRSDSWLAPVLDEATLVLATVATAPGMRALDAALRAVPDCGATWCAVVQPFPMPGKLLTLAYRELDMAANGTEEQRTALGDVSRLPRLWDPASCTTPALRAELWAWLDAVVTWLNCEYVFDPGDAIPSCWPMHAHLVHEIAVLADQRRRAAYSFTSDAAEEWHRYGLPAFLERMHRRVADHCTEAHPPTWPASGRFNRHRGQESVATRQRAYFRDIDALQGEGSAGSWAPRLRIVDEATGEVFER